MASSRSRSPRCGATSCSTTSGRVARSSSRKNSLSLKANMEQRKLGRSPLQVSALGLGLMSMSGVYGNADDGQSISLIHHALERGVNLLDSADMYGWGH